MWRKRKSQIQGVCLFVAIWPHKLSHGPHGKSSLTSSWPGQRRLQRLSANTLWHSTDGAAMRIHALVCVKALCKCFTKVSCYPHPNPAQRKGQSSGKWWLYCSGLLTHTEINGRHLEGDGSFSTSWQVLSSCRLSWGLSCFILLERWCLDWAWWIQLSLLDITVRLYPR